MGEAPRSPIERMIEFRRRNPAPEPGPSKDGWAPLLDGPGPDTWISVGYYNEENAWRSWSIRHHRIYAEAMEVVAELPAVNHRIYRVSLDPETGDPVFTQYPLSWDPLKEIVQLEKEVEEEVSMALIKLDPDIDLESFHLSLAYDPDRQLRYFQAIVALARGELEPPPKPYRLNTKGKLFWTKPNGPIGHSIELVCWMKMTPVERLETLGIWDVDL